MFLELNCVGDWKSMRKYWLSVVLSAKHVVCSVLQIRQFCLHLFTGFQYFYNVLVNRLCSKYYMRLCHASEQCVFVKLVLIIMLMGSRCCVTCIICLAMCGGCWPLLW